MRHLVTFVAGAVLLSFFIACDTNRDKGLIVASGHVEADTVRVSTKVGGILQWFPVEEGIRASEGQELAHIDTTDIELALKTIQADRDQVDADLRLRVAGSRQEDIAEAEAQVARADADLTGAQKDLARMQGLLDAGSGTTKARDDAETRRDVAASMLDAARERYHKLRAGSRQEEIDAALARVASADARIAQLKQQLRDAVIKAPASGILTEKLVQQGELLQAGATLVVVTDIDHAWLTIYIGETDLGRIRIGQEADVTTDDGQARKGKITFISTEAEFTPKNVQTRDERVKLVYRVKVGLDNGDGLFKPGMPAEARIRPAREEPR